jgi:hypothetical protein
MYPGVPQIFPGRRERRRAGDPFGQTEVGEEGAQVVALVALEQHVGRFDVAVHKPLGVHRVKRVGYRGKQGHRFRGRQAAAALPQIRLEVKAVDQAHGKEQSGVWSLPDVIHREDVRMVYCRRRACLAAKARTPLGVCAQIWFDQLQCDAPVQGKLDGLVEFTHAAACA